VSDGAAGATRKITGRDVAVLVIRRQVRLLGLCGLMFFTVSGGAYGLEDMVSLSGPGMTLLLLIITPIIWSVPAALMVAELSTAMPVEGGFYQWVKAGLGEYWGYQEGFWSWITTWVDMAIYPVLFADYLAVTYWHDANAGAVELFTLGPIVVDLHWVIAATIILVFTAINIRGAKLVGDSSVLFMIILLAPFAIMVLIGIPKLLIDGINPFEPFTPQGAGFLTAAGAGFWICMWNYLGWDGLSTVAGEVENPKKTFPLALAIMIPVITLVYVLPVLAGMAGGTEWQAWTAGYFPVVGGNLAGEWLQLLLTFGGLVSAAGLFSALLLSVSRIPFVVARDGYLPKALTREHPRFGTPHISIIVSAIIYAIFCFGAFTSLVVVDVFVYSLALMLEFAALIALRLKKPDMPRPFKIPGGWWGLILVVLLPTLVVLFAVYQTVVDEGISALYLSLAAAALGPITYPLAKRFWKKDHPTEPVVVDGETIWSPS
jgi:amino acid transporter